MSKELEALEKLKRNHDQAIQVLSQNEIDGEVLVFPSMTSNYNLIKQALQPTPLSEIEELEKSDASKEQSSIDYYNEMRKYKSQINAIREVMELKGKANKCYTKLDKIKSILEERVE